MTDANGDTATGTILVDIVDDVPQANNDGTFTVAEGTPLLISTALANDLFGADGVDPATGVAVTTAAAKGMAVYNGDGTFTYTATAGQEGLDTFAVHDHRPGRRHVDGDGDGQSGDGFGSEPGGVGDQPGG